jgi:hypothetical protein
MTRHHHAECDHVLSQAGRRAARAGGAVCLVLLLGLAVGACADDDVPPFLEPGGCGLTGYGWLPADQVGAVVDHAEDGLSPMEGVMVDGLVSVISDILSPVPYGARVFRVRYTTQDKGRLVEATGMIGVPWTEDGPAGEFPVVLFHHGTTGLNGDCAPSALGGENSLIVYLTAALGYVVIAPDYIGLDPEGAAVDHAYIAMEQAALGALDMVRAGRPFVAEVVDTAVEPTGPLVLMGASQGGHAVFATDRLAPYYTPELDICCAVSMIPVSDLLGFAQHAVSGYNAGTFYLGAILASHHRWYEGTEPLTEVLTDASPLHLATALPEAMDTTCDAEDALNGATGIADIFAPGFVAAVQDGDWDAIEPWSCYLRESSPATTSVPRLRDVPLLVVFGENDDLVHTPTQAADFDRLCGQGYRLEYLECAGAGHSDAALWSLPEQLAWVEDRLAGVPLDTTRQCLRTPPVVCSATP